MSKLTLTQAFVNTARCPENKSKQDYFDTKVIGLLLKVLPSDRKSYYLRCNGIRGKVFEKKIADAAVISLEQARNLAIEHLAKLTLGDDPFIKKQNLRDVPTIAEFVNNTYLPFVKTYKKSWDTDQGLIKNHVIPNFGKLYIDQFTKQHLISFISSHLVTHKPGSVNRIIILLRYMFNCAIKWDTPGITKNPTAGIPLLDENNKKERYLNAKEVNDLVTALEKSPNKMLKYIISMLILTGARKREVLDAKWSDFDYENRIWAIPISKTGRRFVPLSDGVLSLLETVPRFNSEWVFPNPDTLKPFVSFFCAWNTARKAAGLGDVRVHDLRHSFASFLVNNGRSLYEVQKILGHTQIKTTQRYAHLNQESLLAAANEIVRAVPVLNMAPSNLQSIPQLS